MTDSELNSVKEKVSKAYIHALSAKVNFALQEFSKDFDSLGYDYSMINHSLGQKRTTASEANEIKIQLKSVSCSSLSMLKESDDFIEYNLQKELIPIGTNCFLIVLRLMEEESVDKWLEFSPDQLIMRKCAYYYKIPQTSLKSGFLKIPRTNILTPDSLISLFESSGKKEEI